MKKKITILIIFIVLVLLILSTTTYALFFKQDKLENEENYTAGILDIVLDNNEEGLGEVLNLANSLPLTDEEGKMSIPYKFKITNKGNLAYTFDLKMLSTTISNQIDSRYIKVMIDNQEPVLLSSLASSIIINDLTLNPGKSKTISVRVWLDEYTPNSQIGKVFSAKIVGDGKAIEEVPATELLLDISLASITIDKGSGGNTLKVSGGGLEEPTEIASTFPIKIEGSTTSNSITVNGGVSNIELNNVNITETSNGTFMLKNGSEVNLTITGENTLDAKNGMSISYGGNGLCVDENSKLTIDGTGILNAIGAGSGIGGGYMLKAGVIVINGGNINASSSISGAGIGGHDLVLVKINGGNIRAIGGIGYEPTFSRGGAGIGGSKEASITGNIIINGGTVYAKGNGSAAGIGGGGPENMGCFEPTTAPNITISPNANVTAIGSGDADNIGNGGFSC